MKLGMQEAPAFGNATGISPPHPHPTKMRNDSNINIPRINKNSNSTTNQACAACKYQRRKCEPNCILSPYFPHNRQAQFLNAHKLFGVSNITKIIRNLSPADKDQAMKAIIFQSDVRASDPVGGCYRIIKELQYMIEYYQAELDLVMHQLTICRSQPAQLAQIQTTKDEQHEPQYLPLMAPDQAVNNKNLSDPNSDVINADSLVVYSPSSLQCSYQQRRQQQRQLNLELGDHRGEGDQSNVNDGIVQDTIGDVWAQHEPNERVVDYCLNQNVEDGFDHRIQSTQKLKLGIRDEEQYEGELIHEATVLNDCKSLSAVGEDNGLMRNERCGDEEGLEAWFALQNCKRRKTM